MFVLCLLSFHLSNFLCFDFFLCKRCSSFGVSSLCLLLHDYINTFFFLKKENDAHIAESLWNISGDLQQNKLCRILLNNLSDWLVLECKESYAKLKMLAHGPNEAGAQDWLCITSVHNGFWKRCMFLKLVPIFFSWLGESCFTVKLQKCFFGRWNFPPTSSAQGWDNDLVFIAGWTAICKNVPFIEFAQIWALYLISNSSYRGLQYWT